MATQEVAIGLKSIYMGPLADDGGMSTDLEKVDYAVIDTPVLTIPEGTNTDFNIEQSDDPYYRRSTPGVKTFVLSIYGLSPEVLERHFGGTVIPGATSADASTWEAPDTIPTVERSIVAEHLQGGYISIVRASISATSNWAFQKNNLPQITITATILTPTKDNTPPMRFRQGALTITDGAIVEA